MYEELFCKDIKICSNVVLTEWERKDGVECEGSLTSGNRYTSQLFEAQVECLQDERCNGISSYNCRSPNTGFNLCSSQDSSKDSLNRACTYIKPGTLYELSRFGF